MDYPRGSEWRKWDLHVHAPGTKLSDGFDQDGGAPDWKRFCQVIHDSDVSAIGITDYFCLDSFFEFKNQYEALFPNDKSKIFFPNLELRLPEVLNDSGSSVNIHVIFRPDLTEDEAHKFLISLDTETTIGKQKKVIACTDLKSKSDFESATVSRENIAEALRKTFGSGVPSEESALIVTSAKGDGIRPGGKGSKKRKSQLADEIDKESNGFFGGPKERGHFLRTDRLESDDSISAKPVFDGCDAHSFDELEARLGKHNVSSAPHCHTTWIKADLTYEGLLQTLAEPEHRVALQAIQPDPKQPYQYISSIKFKSSNVFPDEIVFNRNLNSIIGSRSSGKSALLAFIAYSINPSETVRQQVEASGQDPKEIGPAAGKTWDEVKDISCEVIWGTSNTANGKVIYIPQNSLYSLSAYPDRVTEKITPSLLRQYPLLKVAHDKALDDVRNANRTVEASVDRWFELGTEMQSLRDEITDLGDKGAVTTTRDALKAQMEEIKKKSSLSDEEIATYQSVSDQLAEKREKLSGVSGDIDLLTPLVVEAGQDYSLLDGALEVSISIRPALANLPEDLATSVDEKLEAAENALTSDIGQLILSSVTSLHAERASLEADINSISEANSGLIAKHQANDELEAVKNDYDKQVEILSQIRKKETRLKSLRSGRTQEITKIETAISDCGNAATGLTDTFNSESRIVEGLTFGIESALNEEVVLTCSAAFNKNRTSNFIKKKGGDLEVSTAQTKPSKFLEDLESGALELNKGYAKDAAAKSVLTLTKEIRFTAELEGDVIGGFKRPTMTPGKQALFALTLILNESEEPWPLLIDQPEDDLDSRSIYETIVPYLVARKKERQIIMVSHDANLVIGADSEEIIVANRHGDDMPNHGARTFEYLTGSLEHSQPLNGGSPTVLGRFGIREHACEILDGGEEAFQKRREKYKI